MRNFRKKFKWTIKKSLQKEDNDDNDKEIHTWNARICLWCLVLALNTIPFPFINTTLLLINLEFYGNKIIIRHHDQYPCMLMVLPLSFSCFFFSRYVRGTADDGLRWRWFWWVGVSCLVLCYFEGRRSRGIGMSASVLQMKMKCLIKCLKENDYPF